MIAPASDQLSAHFGERNTVVIAMYTSIFVLAYGEWVSVFEVRISAISFVESLSSLSPLLRLFVHFTPFLYSSLPIRAAASHNSVR